LSHYFCATLQFHNLPVDCARELSKPNPQKTLKKHFRFWFQLFVSDVINKVGLGPLAKFIGACTPIARDSYLSQVFIGNYA